MLWLVVVFFATFPGLAFGQLQTSNKIQLTDLQCLATLTETQYRGTQGLWANVPREQVSTKPELFGAILPGSAKFEWIEPNLPYKGTVARAKIEDIGADRWVVYVPQKGLGCDLLQKSGGKKVVESARVSAVVYSTQTQTPAVSAATQQRLVQVGLAPILPLTATSSSTTLRGIVVVDSGVQVGNPQLHQRVDPTNSASFVGGTAFDDRAGHGTEVAEIIAGRTAGFVSSTPIISYRVLDTVPRADGEGKILVGSEALVLRALLRLHLLPYERLVVNMSLQFWGDPEMWRLAIGSLKDRATFVVSAGNASSGVEPNSNWLPCSLSNLENLICVGGTDGADRKIEFSNFGPAVEIGAPAVVETSLGTVAGTSFSAPQVAGTVGLILEQTSENFSPAMLKSFALGGRFSGYLQGVFEEPVVLNATSALAIARRCASGKCSSSSLSPFSITGVEGTWSGSSKFTYSDLVTIRGTSLVDRVYEQGEVGTMPLRVMVNGYHEEVTVLRATPEAIEIVLPSMFRGSVWAQAQGPALGGESILALVRLVDGVPVPSTATIATRFRPELGSPAVGLIARADGTTAGPDNPIRANETIQIFLSGLEAFTASQVPVEVEFGGVSQKLLPAATPIQGVYVVFVETPKVSGAYGLTGRVSASSSSFDFGVNYDAGVE